MGGVYSSAVDMWAVGCIFAELLLRRPLLPGRDQVHQLSLILSFCGTPSPQDIAAIFPNASEEAVDLLEKLLVFNPEERLTAAQALAHPFFAELHEEDNEPEASPFLDY